MIVLALIILGVVGLTRLPLALLPEMNFPAAVVLTDYENVGPQEVEMQISRPIEEVMATVRNVQRVSSTSAPGTSTVIVEFDWGTDMDFAALEMREQLDMVRNFLPDGADQPQVFRFDPSVEPIFQFNVGGMEDPAALRAFVDDELKNRLERIDGVAQVNISGGLEREIRIEVDQARMEALGLSIDTVQQALMGGNLNLPGGRITEAERELTVRTVGEFVDLDEIKDTVVAGGPAGVVRVGDIARVIDGHKEDQLIARLNGAPSIAISLQREAGANTVTVSGAIRAELDALQERYGDDVFMQVVWDEAEFINMSIRSVVENALTGAVIAMIVLWVFLRSFGSTVIVGSAVPVAGLATFFFLYLMDVSLNILSLGGIALGVGMLVDNAIVSLENIVRHRQQGKTPAVAAVEGTEEVGMALGASTLTTIAVFLPMVFVGGLAAEIFRDLSIAITFSLVMSLLVAVSFIPMVASRVRLSVPIDPDVVALSADSSPSADGDGSNEQAADAVTEAPETDVVAAVADAAAGAEGNAAADIDDTAAGTEGNAAAGNPGGNPDDEPPRDFFIRLRQAYANYLDWILRRRHWAVVGVLVLIASAAVLYPSIGQEFLPTTDTGDIGVRIRLPYGSTQAQTDAVVGDLETFLAEIPDVDTVFASVGAQDGSGSETATMHISMVPRARRGQTTFDVVESIREYGSALPQDIEVRAAVQDPFGIDEVGGAPLIIRLKGPDQDELRDVAEEVAAVVATIEGTRDVETSTRIGRPELQVIVDRERAARHGLAVGQIATSLRSAVDGVVATRYRAGGTGDEIDVRVQLSAEWRSDIESIERLLLPTPMGTTVPLWEVARLEEGIAPVSIDREEQSRIVTVSAQLVDRDLSSVGADVEKRLDGFAFPDEVRWEFGGETLEMDEAFDNLTFALLLAIVLVYMIMAAQFESLVHPFVIMITVPLGLIGAVWGLVVTGRAMSVPALIGVIMLAGIVVNNGIVMIDYVNQLRAAGRTRHQALVTGSATRLRPVLMTAFTTILGMLPLALGIGEGQELQAPIATVVMGGLFVSTMLTLGFLPVVYSYVDDFGTWVAGIGRRIGKRRQKRGKQSAEQA